jgi:hypothetical protein
MFPCKIRAEESCGECLSCLMGEQLHVANQPQTKTHHIPTTEPIMNYLRIFSCFTLLIFTACTDFQRHSTPPPAPPVFLSEPKDAYVDPGDNATFSVIVQSSSPVTLEWERTDRDSDVWMNIDNSNKNSITLENVTIEMANSKYRCIASNAGGTTISNSAIIGVSIQ